MSDLPEEFKAAIDDLIGKLKEKSSRSLSKAESAKILADAFIRFQVKHDFKIGDLAQWKKDFRNLRPKGPFIITEVLPEPLKFNHDKGPAANDTYNAFVMWVDDDGDISRCPIDLNRLEPFVPDAEGLKLVR